METNPEKNVFIVYLKKLVSLNTLKYFSFMYKHYNIYELSHLKVKIIMMSIRHSGNILFSIVYFYEHACIS